jgi:hypothetical protein
MEFWIEGGVQSAKRALKNLPPLDAEKVMANIVLEKESLNRMKGLHPDLKVMDELLPEYRGSVMDYSENQLFDDMYGVHYFPFLSFVLVQCMPLHNYHIAEVLKPTPWSCYV